ncbi:hypothetical protein J6590_054151, partial [Homalodisca vitripennis]
ILPVRLLAKILFDRDESPVCENRTGGRGRVEPRELWLYWRSFNTHLEDSGGQFPNQRLLQLVKRFPVWSS